MNGNWLWEVSCLMISDTGLFTTYCPTNCTFENPLQATTSNTQEKKAAQSLPSLTQGTDGVEFVDHGDEIVDGNNDEVDWEDDNSDDDPLINPQALLPQCLGPDISQEHWEEQLAESLQQLESGDIACYRRALEGSVLLRMSQGEPFLFCLPGTLIRVSPVVGRTRSDAVVVCAVRFSEGIP